MTSQSTSYDATIRAARVRERVGVRGAERADAEAPPGDHRYQGDAACQHGPGPLQLLSPLEGAVQVDRGWQPRFVVPGISPVAAKFIGRLDFVY